MLTPPHAEATTPMRPSPDWTETPVTLGTVMGKLLEIEGYLRGAGEDLLTVNAVYKQYRIAPARVRNAVDRGELKAYDRGGIVRGGFAGFRVKRSDVIRVFDLPPLTAEAAELAKKPARKRA